MDRNPESPWNPRIPADISPADFENLVLEWLRRSDGDREGAFTFEHLGVARGDGGQYKIDVLVRFSALRGASFLVLVECKHQTRPVEREDVMVLESKLRDVNAQKAMLFSTSGFQSGAIEFAGAKGIATVTVIEGAWLFETRSAAGPPPKPPPWVSFDPYAGIWMTKGTDSSSIYCGTIQLSRLDTIKEWLAEAGPTRPA